jgi:hypothetical protein
MGMYITKEENMSDDFQNSIAQEDIQYITEIIREVNIGDNYSKLMVFIEQTKYVLDDSVFATVTADCKMASVTAANYSAIVKGKLKTWLDDFFAAQSTAIVFLVAFTADITLAADFDAAKIALLQAAYDKLYALAYWKTILVTVTSTDTLIPAAAASLSTMCKGKTGLSGPVLLPFSTATPATIASDPVYAAVESATGYAFMVCHYNIDRNGALLVLGLALSVINASGTAVGNSFDMVATGLIDASGALGTPLDVTTQAILKAAKIAYFKPVGDTTGDVALRGAETTKGDVVPAVWIVDYCNYVNKVKTARYVTKMNTFRNNAVYQGILLLMSSTINLFTAKSGSGRLTSFSVTAPSFEQLPAGGDTITVPNGWAAKYVDNVRNVNVYGQLTIPA